MAGTTTSVGNSSSGYCSDSSGAYTVVGLPTGNYQVDFFDYTGAHFEQWWNNQPTQATANIINVTIGNSTAGIDASLATALGVPTGVLATPGNAQAVV